MDISKIREEYTKAELIESNMDLNPLLQFKVWFENAVEAKVNEPNAMHLATINEHNRPSGRIVLLKYFNESGFSFFSNYNSNKGKDLARNSFACITFFWPELERQVRIEGEIWKLSEAESEKYFAERPRKSQIGALASAQSETVANREVLERNFDVIENEYLDKTIPKPLHWGGYILMPNYYEFWQGRRSRLHDRLIYKATEGSIWQMERLSP